VFDDFLRARRLQMGYREAEYLEARRYLERAVKKDPRFADGWVALAGTYWTSAIDGFMQPGEAWRSVGEYLEKAERLKPDLPDLHFARAITSLFGKWKWADAERHFQLAFKALDGDDMQPELRMGYALKYWALGDPTEALRIVSRARKVDPLSPGFMLHEATYLVEVDRQLDKAAALCLAVAAAHPENWSAYFTLADIRHAQLKFTEAIDARLEAHRSRGDDEDVAIFDEFADAVGEHGYRRIVEAAIERIELRNLRRRRDHEEYASPLDFARAYAQLDMPKQAFEKLDEALEERSPMLVLLNVDHAWDSIRSDSRFLKYVKAVSLPVRRS
jgi:tetratricopeptide (TPR) repeat protein